MDYRIKYPLFSVEKYLDPDSGKQRADLIMTSGGSRFRLITQKVNRISHITADIHKFTVPVEMCEPLAQMLMHLAVLEPGDRHKNFLKLLKVALPRAEYDGILNALASELEDETTA